MSAVIFKLIREKLGLSLRDLTHPELLGVNKRTISRWEGRQEPLPRARLAQLLDVHDQFFNLVERYGKAIIAQCRKANVNSARLVVYMNEYDWLEFVEREPLLINASLHRRFIIELWDYVAKFGMVIEPVAFDASSYLAWLGGRVDSGTMREAWAAEQ